MPLCRIKLGLKFKVGSEEKIVILKRMTREMFMGELEKYLREYQRFMGSVAYSEATFGTQSLGIGKWNKRRKCAIHIPLRHLSALLDRFDKFNHEHPVKSKQGKG